MADEHPSEDNARSNRSDEIELEPWYKDGNDDIVEPDQVTLQTQYFWKNWVRILGVGPSALLIRLRMYCYFNRRTGERRNFCVPGQDTLAYELGVGDRKTIRRWLQRLEVFDFIRKKHRARWSDHHGHHIRTTNRYVVKMWDPVAPEHEGAAFLHDAQRMLADSHDRLETQPSADKGQNAPQQIPSPVDNPVERKNAPQQGGGKMPQLKKYLEEVPNERNVGGGHSETLAHSSGPMSVASVLNAAPRRRQPRKRRHLADVLLHIQTSPEQRDRLLRVEDLGNQMASQLRDPNSIVFYRKVARRFLEAGKEQLVYRALSEIKEGAREGRLESLGAVFTTRIKDLAAMNDIEL